MPQGHEFELYEVRFHWGRENQRGSEHTVNFKAFPMEVRRTKQLEQHQNFVVRVECLVIY